jgi:hypothetical protein
MARSQRSWHKRQVLNSDGLESMEICNNCGNLVKMEFKDWLNETLTVGGLNFEMPDFSQAKHIGDVGGGENKILHYEYGGTNVYGITVDDKVVGYLQTMFKEILGKPYEEIKQIYVEPQFRGRNLMLKLLFFVKSYLKKSFVGGEVQSQDGQGFIRSLARTKRFPMFWFNTETGERHPYDPVADYKIIQPYRGALEPTVWRVLIEGLNNESSVRLENAIPRFFNLKDPYCRVNLFDGWVEMLEEDNHKTWKRESRKLGAHFICEKKDRLD